MSSMWNFALLSHLGFMILYLTCVCIQIIKYVLCGFCILQTPLPDVSLLMRANEEHVIGDCDRGGPAGPGGPSPRPGLLQGPVPQPKFSTPLFVSIN